MRAADTPVGSAPVERPRLRGSPGRRPRPNAADTGRPPRLHLPDCAVCLRDRGTNPAVLAVELERTAKGRARLRRILSGYVAARHIDAVRYYATTERVRNLVEAEVASLRAQALIEIRHRSSNARADFQAAWESASERKASREAVVRRDRFGVLLKSLAVSSARAGLSLGSAPTTLVLATLALAGCGDSGGARVSESERQALPTDQLTLGSNLCPEEWDEMDLAQGKVRRQQAEGRKQLAALEAAYAKHPDAVVETTYESSEGGTVTEDLAVRKLARSHLLGVTEDVPRPPCLQRVARRLRALLR